MAHSSCVVRQSPPSVSLVLLLIALTFSSAAAQRGFGGYKPRGYGGYPGFGGRHYGGDFDVFGRPSYGRYSDVYEDDYGYRCPEYKQASYTRWQEADDGRIVTRVALPGVHADNQRVRIGEDGTSLHVRAARSIAAQGGRRCLPRGASISADGSAEILDFDVPLPALALDVERTSVRNVQGGIELLVPRRSHPSRMTHSEPARAPVPTGAAPRTHKSAGTERHNPQAMHSRSSADAATTAQRPSSRDATVKQRQMWFRPKPTWTLPPSDGVEVIDDDWPEPEKLATASSGWWDNRGEFQEY